MRSASTASRRARHFGLFLCLLSWSAWAQGDPPAKAEQPSPERTQPQPLALSGGVYLWHYEPLSDLAQRNTELNVAWLAVEAAAGSFGVHVESRIRGNRLRPYYGSNFWVQEAYVSWRSALGTLKGGKLYSRFGRFWDDSFYGNLGYYDGIKLDPDVGLSFEGARPLTPSFDLEYAAQYFVVDGLTNGSLEDRDTVSVFGAHQRNGQVLRFGGVHRASDLITVSGGLSGQHFEADLPGPSADDHVYRYGSELALGLGPLRIHGEYIRQRGRSVVDHPLPAMPSDTNDYWQGGAQAEWRWLAARYNLSAVYYHDGDVREVLHQPGLTLTLNAHLAILAEYVYWRRHLDEGPTTTMDHSLNFVLYASF